MNANPFTVGTGVTGDDDGEEDGSLVVGNGVIVGSSETVGDNVGVSVIQNVLTHALFLPPHLSSHDSKSVYPSSSIHGQYSSRSSGA